MALFPVSFSSATVGYQVLLCKKQSDYLHALFICLPGRLSLGSLCNTGYWTTSEMGNLQQSVGLSPVTSTSHKNKNDVCFLIESIPCVPQWPKVFKTNLKQVASMWSSRCHTPVGSRQPISKIFEKICSYVVMLRLNKNSVGHPLDQESPNYCPWTTPHLVILSGLLPSAHMCRGCM